MPDTQHTLTCPACGAEMTKLFIAEKGISIDICANGCGGIYFDNQEIQEFSGENEDLSEIRKLLDGKNFMPVDETQTRICPACKTPMAKTNAFGIQIDTCYKCGGIFLDNGEFEKIRTHFKKRQKIQPVNVGDTSEIDLRKFYKEAQDEEFCKTEGYRRAARILMGRRRNLVGLLFDLIFQSF